MHRAALTLTSLVGLATMGYASNFAAQAGTRPAMAAMAPDDQPTLMVRGEARLKSEPGLARVTAAVVTTAPTLKDVSGQHAPRAAQARQALDALKDRGVSVRGAAFRLFQEEIENPDYRARDRQRTVTQGVAVTQYDIEITPVAALDQVVSDLAETGLVQVRGIRYALSDPAAELNAARRRAMEDAREQARVYAEAGGFMLGPILSVSDGSSRVQEQGDGVGYAPMARAAAAPSQGAQAPTTIDTHASVAVTYRILTGRDPTMTPR